jgi:hypothetical protein
MVTVAAHVSSPELDRLWQRLMRLEAEVHELKTILRSKSQSEPWWQAIAGKFDGDPFFEQMVIEGRKWRQSQRPKVRAKGNCSKARAKRTRS